MVLASSIFAYYKYRALAYEPVDYTLYAQFAARIANFDAETGYSMNSFGRNTFLMKGIESVDTIHQSIHFEPVKYFTATLYAVTNSPVLIFIFYSIGFFSPVLYAFFLYRKSRNQLLLWGITAYALYPATIHTATADLRPLILLTPVLILLILSIIFERSRWEQIIFFNLLFLIREEALIIAGAIIVFVYLRHKLLKVGGRQATVFLKNYLLWLVVMATYFMWTGYAIDTTQLSSNKLGILGNYFLFLGDELVFAIIIAAMALLGVIVKYRRQLKSLWLHYTPQISFAVILMPLVLIFVLSSDKPLSEMIYGRYELFAWSIILSVLFAIGARGSNEKTGEVGINFATEKVSYLITLFLILCIPFFINGHLVGTNSTYNTFLTYKKEKREADFLFALRDKIPSSVGILTDFSTAQLFYASKNMYVYNRLPYSMVKDIFEDYSINKKDERYQKMLSKLIQKRVQLAVSESSYEEEFLEILKRADMRVESLEGNVKYEVFAVCNKKESEDCEQLKKELDYGK